MSPVVIGNATLYLGDCLDILPGLPKVDAVITDPPYGVGLTKKTSDFRGSHYFDYGVSLKASVAYIDDFETIENLIKTAIPIALQKAKRAAITPGTRMMFSYPRPKEIGAIFTPNGAGLSSWGFQCSHPILYYGKCPYLSDGKGSRPNGFKTEQPNKEKIDHPCPKPLEWMIWLVNRASRACETILDPFMGSGTTGVACMQMGRSFIGIEKEPKYFEIACKRIEAAQKQPDMFIEPKPAPRAEQASLFAAA